MTWIEILASVLLLVYFAATKVLPRLLSWYCEQHFHSEVRIGKIGVLSLSLHNVHIKRSGITIQMEKVSLSSSFVNSEITKLLAIIVHDVRINKDIGGGEETPEVIQSHSEPFLNKFLSEGDLRGKKVPPWAMTFAQFLGVHIYDVHVMFLRVATPECLLHATAEQLHLDGSTFHNAWVSASVSIVAASAKVLKHVPEGMSPQQAQPCLGEISFALNAQVKLGTQGPVTLQSLKVNVHQPQASVNEGFFTFLEEKRRCVTRPSRKVSYSSEEESGEEINWGDVTLRLAPLLPQEVILTIEETSLKVMNGLTLINMSAVMHSFDLKAAIEPAKLGDEANTLPLVDLSATLQNLDVCCNHESIFNLSKVSWELKLSDLLLDTDFQINSLSVAYNHKEFQTWLQVTITRSSGAQISDEPVEEQRHSIRFLQKLIVKANVELWNVMVGLHLPNNGPGTYCGFTHQKWTSLLQLSNVGDCLSVESLLLSLEWELLLESLWCSSGTAAMGESANKKQHFWGSPFFVSFLLAKVKPSNSSGIRVQAMVDTARCEWSPRFGAFLIQAVRCVEYYKDFYKRKTPPFLFSIESDMESTMKKRPSLKQIAQNCSVNLKLANVNVFLLSESNVGLMLRVDVTTMDLQETSVTATVEGAKFLSIKKSGFSYTCHKAAEMKNSSAHVRKSRVTAQLTTREVRLEVAEEMFGVWSPLMHMQVWRLCQELTEFAQHFTAGSPVKRPDHIELPESTPAPLTFHIHSKARIILGALVSPNHRMDIMTEELVGMMSKKAVEVEAKEAEIRLDGHEIVTGEGLKFSMEEDSESLKLERKSVKGMQLPLNKLWSVNIDSLKMQFPYKYEFAYAFNEKCINVVKWLKLIHGRSRKPFTTESPLPPDLLIKVKHFSMQLDDDPFEVKLRDNYELLEDEYHESLKRQAMMAQKVEDLRKTHLLLPAGKVDEVYAHLNRLNSQIYIQRSQKMYQGAPVRKHLFVWIMDDLEVLAMADPSMHGEENVVGHMQEIDMDSPWPEEGLSFSTLWCRAVQASFKVWKFQLRDFPQPLMDIREMHVWGRLVGAEQEAPKRARRVCTVEVGESWGSMDVERGMTGLKFYHDLSFDVDHLSFAYGPCWEPVIAQCNIGFEKISSPSKDPSPPMPFWDKIRMLFHGRMTTSIQQLTLFLHASLDPYNTTEEMEVTWTEMIMDWTNGKFVFRGDLNVCVRTASKYDDCRLLHLPQLKLTMKLEWLCLGDPNDHHSVLPCAPDKLPEYSSNQEHDSFRAFRSQNLNMSVAMETKGMPQGQRQQTVPTALLFGSTLRWFENLKLILSGVSRPIRRGALFGNTKPKKLSLSRHYRKSRFSVSLHCFQVCYWMSFSMQKGFKLHGGRLSSSSEHTLTLVSIEDGLKHRPRADWSIAYMNSELNDSEIWLQSVMQEEANMYRQNPVEKYYFISVTKVSYGRETFVGQVDLPGSSDAKRDTPTHRLVVHDMKGAWTKSNRDIAFALFDGFVKSQQMKKNLSTAALKGFRVDSALSPHKSRGRAEGGGGVTPGGTTSVSPLAVTASTPQAPPSSGITKLQSGHAATMLQKLIAEADNNSVVFSEDLSTPSREEHLQGVPACQTDDVTHKNWLIELVNSQVLLKGCETKGYVILSAAKAQIYQRVHRPVWRDHSLVSKTTWVGTLDCMQYYATVNADENVSLDENIMWLTVDNIQEKDSLVISELPDLVGSGQSVGGVVSETVGATTDEGGPLIQLQRIASRCRCEFFYVSYGESSLDPSILAEAPPPPTETFGEAGLWEKQEDPVDAFTLMHHDLNVCTNSLQYAMILDIVNNLLLYVEPRRKEASEKLQRMRFQLQLSSTEDQRKPIQQLQSLVRSTASRMRRMEKEAYQVQRALAEDPGNEKLAEDLAHREREVNECKQELIIRSEELNMMISCYKETQLLANQKMATTKSDKPVTIIRANEICFKHAQWRLTEADGQLGIADLVLSNFLYTKKSKSDDSVEHLLELGYINMTNLLPNQVYSEVLSPTEIQSNMPVDRLRSLRVFCRERAPVAGISVKEHFEINVVPLTIAITIQFFNTMVKFCFPEKDPEAIDPDSDYVEVETKSKKGRGKRKESSFYVPIEEKDDVEKMKERAEQNKLFIYIKIPEVPVKVSYKGSKEKNIEDVHEFSLVIPTLEYHNVTWTWLDLLMVMKRESKRVLLSQAIKLKLQIKPTRQGGDDGPSPQEEDKARILLGSKLVPQQGSSKSLRRSLFKSSK